MSDDAREGEPRVGRKALLFLVLGALVALFLPLIGLLALVFLAFAWIILILAWVLAGAQTRRPLVYILAFTIGFIGTLFLLGALSLSIFSAFGLLMPVKDLQAALKELRRLRVRVVDVFRPAR